MFHDFHAGSGNDKACAGGDVEGVVTIATGTYDVDCLYVVAQVNGCPSAQQSIAETGKHDGGDAPHQEYCHECRELGIVISPVGYIEKNVGGLFPRQTFVLKHFVEDTLHFVRFLASFQAFGSLGE